MLNVECRVRRASHYQRYVTIALQRRRPRGRKSVTPVPYACGFHKTERDDERQARQRWHRQPDRHVELRGPAANAHVAPPRAEERGTAAFSRHAARVRVDLGGGACRDRLYRDSAIDCGRSACSRRIQGVRAVRVGRPDRPSAGAAGIPPGRRQRRRGAGAAGRHASRRHALLRASADRRQHRAWPACDQSRVHGRRPAAYDRLRRLEQREGQEVAERAWRERDRGGAAGERVARGATVTVRAPASRQARRCSSPVLQRPIHR